MMTQAQASAHARRIPFNFSEPLPTNVEHALRKRVDKQLRRAVLTPVAKEFLRYSARLLMGIR